MRLTGHRRFMLGLWWAVYLTVGAGCGAPTAPAGSAGPARGTAAYPAEEQHRLATGADLALADLHISASQWPDCYTDATAMADIFRIEGVADRPGQAQALAFWKWFRILTSATGGGYPYVLNDQGKEYYVVDPHELFTVYGHHQCDGLSWMMEGLWRASGQIAFDECHFGHTIASLRYQDTDGCWRFHDFDPQSRYYYWDPEKKIVGTWTLPVIRARVHRHLLAPLTVHTLSTGLHWNETIERRWDAAGEYVVQSGLKGANVAIKGDEKSYYRFAPGKTDGVYAAAGEECQQFKADFSAEHWQVALADGSTGLAASSGSPGKPGLRPAKTGAQAVAIYRLSSPYVAVEADVTIALSKAAAADTAALSLSVDGGQTWQPVWALAEPGASRATVSMGRAERIAGQPSVYGCYGFLMKVELHTAGDPAENRLEELAVTVHRQLNKRTLPNLRPGRNLLRVDAQSLAPGHRLELQLDYAIKGEARSVTRRIDAFPFYFGVETGEAAELLANNYDKVFNVGDIQMRSLRARVIAADGRPADVSLPAAEAQLAFAAPCPHPADLNDRKDVKWPETDPIQTTGFFPQDTEVKPADDRMGTLIETLQHGKGLAQWTAAEDLGAYPEALDALIAALPEANGDLTLHLCKALAQIHSPKAFAAVAAKWEQAPHCAPGTRYLPDVMAAMGDRRAVPLLLEKLPTLRFDYRLHIAYALGRLGGPEAAAALDDLAQHDPFPALRDFAADQRHQGLARGQ